jgi:hypothetical protein
MKSHHLPAQLDQNETPSERTNQVGDILAKRHAKHEASGRVPAGYRIAGSVNGTRRIEIDSAAGHLVQDAFWMAAREGCSIRKIATYLGQQRLSRYDGKPLTPMDVYRLLHDHTYLGTKDGYESLVDHATFHSAFAALAGRSRARDPFP